MITVNKTKFEYEEGLTMKSMVDKAMQKEGFESLKSVPLLYMLNGSVVPMDKLEKTVLADGDVIKLFLLNSGG